jgi:hypothetical protein
LIAEPMMPSGWSFVFTSAPREYEWLTLEATPPGSKFELFRLHRENGLNAIEIEFLAEVPGPSLPLADFESALAYARAIYLKRWLGEGDSV